jgi:hypothetical protein
MRREHPPCDHPRRMPTSETVSGLSAFERRGAGTDAERRAASWLKGELDAGGREVTIEPFWCHPSWAFAHAWHVALGLVGSLLAVGSPRLGGVLILLSLLSVIADALFGASPGRRLTPERASQNVIAAAPESDTERRVCLVVTANYDAVRTGVAYWRPLRDAAARFRGLTPGWLGWLVIALVWLEAVAIARVTVPKGMAIGAAQLVPTVGLVLALALLLELASSQFGPSAGDNASGVAVAIALARALDAAPPRHAAAEIVLAGAGDGSGIGLRRYLRARKGALTHGNTVVLGIAACAGGSPRWWVSDGPFLPLPYFAKLRELCAALAREEPGLGARPHRGRGSSPAFAARLARLPAITIGCLDEHQVAPRSHRPSDTVEAIDEASLDRAVELGLLLVDAIDAFVGARGRRPPQLDSTASRVR